MINYVSLRGAKATRQSSASKKLDCFAMLAMTILLSSCSLAPDFVLPEVKTPEHFEQSQIMKAGGANWKVAQSSESVDRGEWWEIFADQTLNELQKQASEANNSLAAAAARVESSRATARASASTFFPTIDLGANAVRSKPASAASAAFGGSGAQLKPYTLYSAQAVASYEVDLFGRVRDNEKALISDTESTEAMYKNILLALQADVAQHYYYIRALDTERDLLRDTVIIREEALRIMQKQFDLGEVGEQDLSRIKSELAGVKAELLALDRQRTIYENALAVLLGKLPSDFSLAEKPLVGNPPRIPAGVPSSLLERRPDISAAISTMQAANARIGVARTAYFPILNLTASAGSSSSELGELFDWSSRTWALGQLAGDALSVTIFNDGRTGARVDAAHATYKEAVENYRGQVLSAFRDVEDNLSAQRLLSEQSQMNDEAARSARRTTEIVLTRYDEGDVNYFEVVSAWRDTLAAERAAVQVRGQRFVTAIELIRALGGGWQQ